MINLLRKLNESNRDIAFEEGLLELDEGLLELDNKNNIEISIYLYIYIYTYKINQ